MNTQFTIQKASPDHAADIARFNIAMALETENRVLKHDEIEPGVNALFSRPELGFYIVALHDQKVVGSLMITKEWSDWRNGLFWWIQSVYVLPEYRRKGVYRAMYNRIKELAQQEGEVCGFRLYVENENLPAQKTYSSLGMKETYYKLFEEEV
jgi:ribosomal protein S18 acetylase RimI-like enzyme